MMMCARPSPLWSYKLKVWGCGEWEAYIGSVVNMLWTFDLAKFITDGRVGNKGRGSREQGGTRILDPANDLPCSNQLSCWVIWQLSG